VRDADVTPWDDVPYDEKLLWERKMEIYAAMVDRVDQNIGKLREKLKALKKDENTLIVFISDNGAQGGYAGASTRRPQRNSGPAGSAGSYVYQDQPWAYVSNTPHSSYKNNMHEGGISAPFIAWFPKTNQGGHDREGHWSPDRPRTDILRSCKSFLSGDEQRYQDESIAWEKFATRTYRQGG
jgi:arylsulfatase A-like enzyme